MAVDPIASLSRCKMSCRVYTLADGHFYRVYLWRTLYAMYKQVGHRGSAALHRAISWRFNPSTGRRYCPPMMGDLHFVSGKWDEEVVSHECSHALFQYQRTHGLYDISEMEVEEQLCYFQGDLSKKVYRWLWTNDKE